MNDQLQKLKEQGYKLTKPRCLIMEALTTERPLTAEEILLQLGERAKVNLSTVYRNLNMLMKMDLIRKVNSPEQANRYELVRHQCHHALQCVDCGTQVIFSQCLFEQLIREVESKTHFQVEKHVLELFGTCPKCNLERQKRLAE